MKSEQEAFLQVKLSSAMLIQGLRTKCDAGFGHSGEQQSTDLDIYVTSELWNKQISRMYFWLIEEIDSVHTSFRN